uniref:PK_Tyr_Ser-Thr domain-containing protein n=1 Tax=Caenorhabditis japonica TaxID=281687 RepID=A0A8R1IW54_CAEJA
MGLSPIPSHSSEAVFMNIYRTPIQDVVRYIEKGYRMEAPEGCPPEVFKVMNETWALSAQDRPTFGEVLKRLSDIAVTV